MNQVTQSQPVMQLNDLTFLAVTSIAGWAGKGNTVCYFDGDPDMPYVEKAGTFFYFGLQDDEYRLLCSFSRDLGVKGD